MLTLFSAPKPFQGHIDVIQRNAIGSWLQLGSDVEILLVGDEEGLAEIASEYGVSHLQQVARNEYGTPLINSIFELACQNACHPLLCYINADIILLDDFLPQIRRVADTLDRFLIVGQRWDLDVRDRIRFDQGWLTSFRVRLEREASRHSPVGSDYFVYPRSLFSDLPPFALGRPGWDNWMIYAGRAAGTPVIDASEVIDIVHQDHDYSHMPDRTHYRSPEHLTNRRLAGGRTRMFTLIDCDWRLTSEGIDPPIRTWSKTLRAFETWPVLTPGFEWLAGLFQALVHPWISLRRGVRRLRREIGTQFTPRAEKEERQE